MYWKSNEESVIGDRQKASTMEVKKPVSATSTSNTRADRVHGKCTSQGQVEIKDRLNWEIFKGGKNTFSQKGFFGVLKMIIKKKKKFEVKKE